MSRWIVAALVVISVTLTVFSMRKTSSTFDEIAPITVGARGWETGDWTMMTRFPPVMAYLYGLPGYLSKPNYPAETAKKINHYEYARQMLWRENNNAEALIFRARLIAALIVGGLVLLTYGFTRAYFGTNAGLIAATLVAFMPDVLGHGGVAYNDVPGAAAFLAALWTIDRTVRNPTWKGGLAAGLLASLALGIKHSALALGPIAIVLLVMEAVARDDRRAWLKQAGVAVGIAALAGYVLQVLLYRGDFALRYLVDGVMALGPHVAEGHKPSDPKGTFGPATWIFYPFTFAHKTPAALHILMLFAAAGAVLSLREDARRNLLLGAARGPVVALIVFGTILLRAKLVIGFRYALPMLPLIAILAAAGSVLLWTRRREFKVATIALVVWAAASTLSFYPNFLAYSSEYPPDRAHAYEVLNDSSLDWGQGLIALREFMKEENVDQVYLGYFGSAIPEGYGINFIPLPSFLPLNPKPVPANPPKYAVVSATLLAGRYLLKDTYAGPRQGAPYRILGGMMYVYEAD